MSGPGIYLHIPYCRSKCRYCAFVSRPCGGRAPAGYLRALLRQVEEMGRHPWCREREFATLFIGGGTPTVYGGEAVAALVAAVGRAFCLAPGAEITVESNPNALEAADLRHLRAAGVNRLSIGVQSFDAAQLTALGRTHSPGEARAAVKAARRAGVDNINLDLMYGLPGQDKAGLAADVEQALALGVEHLALYELSIEDGTPFARLRAQGRLPLPAEDEVVEMEAAAHSLLAQGGLERYEISNFARPGHQCRHNLNYWRNGSYVGLGAAAVGCYGGLRLRAVDDPERFAARIAAGRPPWAQGEMLGDEASFRETVIMGLRLMAGVDISSLRARYGLDPAACYGPVLTRLRARGLVEESGHHLRLTGRALPVANQVLAELV